MASAPTLNQRNGVEIDYRALFDAVPGLFLILDSRLSIVSLNQAYASATMIDKAAVIGRHLFDVFPDNPDDPAADGVRNLHASLQRVLALKRPDVMVTQKYDIRMPDGKFEERFWSPVNTPVLDADGEISLIIHQVENVTDLKRLHDGKHASEQADSDQERTLREMRILNSMLATTLRENRKLQADRIYLADVVASSNDAIITRTLDGRVAGWNRAAELMYGYKEEEVIGKPVAMLAPALQADESKDLAARLERGETVSQYETVRRRRDGSEFPVSISASLVRNAAGQVTGTSAIVRDITERRHADERMRALQSELIHLSRWNTMGMMASTIAHELNQPLTATMNYVRAARRVLDSGQPARIGEFLDKAVEETKLAGGIIRSLREFIDKRETSRAPENINTVVEEAIALSLVGGGEAGARLTVTMEPLLPPVLVDKIQIEQVLLNLIRNALDAMGDAADKTLDISTALDEPGFVRVSVADNGPGIAPEMAEQLFTPFVTSKEKGMGIGLTICQSIIEAHGGRIWTEAPAGAKPGAVFHFRLPGAEHS